MDTRKLRLTNQVAEAAPRADARYVIWDNELAGFGLRVAPNGTRSWIVRYRAGGGRHGEQRFISLGKYPTVGSPSARAAATKLLAAAALGLDPAGEKLARRRLMSVSDLIDLYDAEGAFVQRGIRQGQPMKAATKAYTMARLRHHVVPLLGNRRAADLTEGDIERLARDVAAGKTAKDQKVGPRKRIIVRGGEGAARKVIRDLSAVLSFAQRRRIISANPVATAAVRKTDNCRVRFLSFGEVKSIGSALTNLESKGANPKSVNQARLWALTGCRRNEIAALKWAEVDLARGLLILGDSKTGRSIRPLGGAAVALLSRLHSEAAKHDGYVFPAERGDGFYQGAKRTWSKAIQEAGLTGITPHTLRHTLGSAAASSGEALLMVGALLGHANARSTAIYAHVQHDPARLAADRATAPIAAALGLRAAQQAPCAANDTVLEPDARSDGQRSTTAASAPEG